jgi:catechol 2,3-dioxygenase-like lactoylglutathione lyase family enzyme
LAVAKDFYETKLGLKRVATEGDEALVYRSGVSKVVVYRSEYAGTNRATTANWMVGKDLEREVEALKGRGVRFEHYDMPGLTRQGDVHVAGDMKVAWFKDPDGNILSLVSG